MTDVGSPGNDLASLLAQYEESVGQTVPHYRPQNEFRHAVVVARNGELLPRPEKLTFTSPPPMPAEPTFNERLEPLLQPLRERVEAAESVLQRRTAEAQEALSFRNDIERAAASVRNVEAGPPRQPSAPSPKACMAMSDSQWEQFKESYRNGDYR